MRKRVARVAALLVLASALAFASPAAASFPGKNGRIYFGNGNWPRGHQTDVYSMSSRGTHIRLVREFTGLEHELAVSPNGRRIAFVHSILNDDDYTDVWLGTMKSDGSDVTRLPGPVGGVERPYQSPAFTPDGRTIAYVGYGFPFAPYSDIYTIAAHGREPGSPLLTLQQDVTSPNFSPDGTKIAYAQNDGGESPIDANLNIYVADADGTDPIQVTDGPGFEVEPDFSPNGRRIVYTRPHGIFDMRVLGSDVRQLTNKSDGAPDYSPNGEKIIYLRRPGRRATIFKMNADGSHERRLTKERTFLFTSAPDWAPKPH